MRSSGTLLCLGSGAALRRDGGLRQARLRRGRDGRHAARGALRARRGAVLGARLARRAARRASLPRACRRRDVGIGLALGACGYALQAGCYFAALERIDASLLSLLLYTFPAIVAVGRGRARPRAARPRGGWARSIARVRRPRAGRRRRGRGRARPARRRARPRRRGRLQHVHPRQRGHRRARARRSVLAALVCTGAAVALTLGSALLGELHPGELTAAGWGWLACLAGVSTVGAIGLFFAGLRARRADRPPRSSPPSSRSSPWCSRSSSSARRSDPRSLPAARSCSRAVLVLQCAATVPAEDDRMSRPLKARSRWSRGATRGGGRGIAVALGEAGRDGLRDRPQHARAALGDRPAGDDRGDRRARHRGGRRGHRRRGRPPRPRAGRGAGRADRRRAGPPRRARQRHLGRRAPVRVGHAALGARPRQRPAAAAPRDRHPPDHQPPRAAAAVRRPAGWSSR